MQGSEKFYRAPWSKSLKTSSIWFTVLCLGIAFCPHTLATPANPPFFWLRLIPLVLFVSALFFIVRGYTVTPTDILIHRLVWPTRISLAALESAKVEPKAMSHSLRLWGNGGLYSITGIYRNGALGKFRAFVTDPDRTVVVRAAARTFVLSPHDPASFVQILTPKN